MLDERLKMLKKMREVIIDYSTHTDAKLVGETNTHTYKYLQGVQHGTIDILNYINEWIVEVEKELGEVVHCENCRHKDRVSDYCMYLKREINPEDFCCCGVQKKGIKK